MRVDDQPAYVLHSRAWRESSLLLECLTPEHGRVGLLARGARAERSRLRGLLQPLQPLVLGWRGSGELPSLTRAEACAGPVTLAGEGLLAAMYLNELVLRLSARGEAHSHLFAHYALCLARLAGPEPQAWTLRRFERDFLADLGYALVLDHATDSDEPLHADADYAYVPDSGPQAWQAHPGSLRISGAALLALGRDELPTPSQAVELRRLMRGVLQHQLGGGSLNAWTLHGGLPKREGIGN